MNNMENNYQNAENSGGQEELNNTGEQNSPEELYTLPFSILTAEAHNLLFQWLEKQSDGHFIRDNFVINKIYRRYYGCLVFWFAVKPDAKINRDPMESAKKHEIVVIPGSNNVPQEIISIAQHYNFMKLTEIDPNSLSSSEFTPILVSEDDSQEKAFEKLKKQQPSFFDDHGNLKEGIELNMSFPAALPVWEGIYNQRSSRDYKFYIDGQTGEVIGESYLGKNHGLGGIQINFPQKYKVIAAVTAAIILLLFLISKVIPAPSKSQHPTKRPKPAVTRSEDAKKKPAQKEKQNKPDVTKPAATNTPAAKPVNENTNAANNEELVKKVIEDNFKYINEKNYESLYGLRSESVKNSNSIVTYEERYTNNVGIRLEKISVEEVNSDNAQLVANYASTDRRGGKDENSGGEIRFYLIKENGKWVINDSKQLSETAY